MSAPRRRTALRTSGLVLAACAAGCVSDDTRARLVQVEVELARAQQEVAAVSELEARVAALEARLALRPSGDDDLAARLAALEAATLELRARLDALAAPPAEEEPAAAPTAPERVIETPGGGAGALPPEGEPLNVLTVGSGELLLIRTEAGLERLEVLGIEAPRRAEAYAHVPEEQARHEAAFGPLADDRAWEASRTRLEELIRAGVVVLRYAGDRRNVATGAIRAYLERPAPDGPRDLGAAMIQEGYALAAPEEHPRAVAYRRLEQEALEARAGLRAPAAEAPGD